MAGKNCIICGDYSGNFDLCKDCYYEKQDYYNEFFEAFTKKELVDYYNNLKYYIFKIKDKEYEISAYLKLIALAEVYDDEFNSSFLLNKVDDDIANIQSKKENYQKQYNNQKPQKSLFGDDDENEETEIFPKEETKDLDTETIDYRLLYPMTYHCEDGHYVRSTYEQLIDDYLTSKEIIHYYEKRCKNFDTGETYYPDWFLPKITEKGVYIECFGINDEKYKEKTQKKLAFYKKENLNVIEIYPKHINNFKEFLDDKIEEFRRKK